MDKGEEKKGAGPSLDVLQPFLEDALASTAMHRAADTKFFLACRFLELAGHPLSEGVRQLMQGEDPAIRQVLDARRADLLPFSFADLAGNSSTADSETQKMLSKQRQELAAMTAATSSSAAAAAKVHVYNPSSSVASSIMAVERLTRGAECELSVELTQQGQPKTYYVRRQE